MSVQRDRLARSERELRDERGSALVRIATTLEDLIDQLHALHREWISASSAGERTAIRDRYRLTRTQALLYRWYLEVQREAVGLTRHAMLDEVYRVPGPLRDCD